MAKWNDQKNFSMTFKVEPNEDAVAYFERMEREMQDRETAFKERIKQLFDEEIDVGVKSGNGYATILRVFAIGYQHGWNDCHSLNKDKEQCPTK